MHHALFPLALILSLLTLSACDRLAQVGKAPAFTPLETPQHNAIYTRPPPWERHAGEPAQQASLWTGSRKSLFGDRRAGHRGDILTVVIEINDKAEISNSTGRSRDGSESMGIPQMLGLPQRIDRHLPSGASMADAISATGSSSYKGQGSVQRNEKLTLRVAATVVEELPNGVLRIEGSQEVRVNFELRDLVVTGYVRPEDVTRTNEITYDKIAGARIAYGGRGQITDVQQPRYGQQVTDIVLPF
ncbi:flagellar basal body L-ring protein FlgH [Acidimangrovimonas sediminis]|uniref:flagellar basal body L-ring protein FlgH n=1 Tax=Acidimangrovimonas sediminis TaxID=2056283 RepID=UPI000C80ABBF|nr:flagellar basal body L-ring protein FlgH [Acidimangrovimonas sediminis]